MAAGWSKAFAIRFRREPPALDHATDGENVVRFLRRLPPDQIAGSGTAGLLCTGQSPMMLVGRNHGRQSWVVGPIPAPRSMAFIYLIGPSQCIDARYDDGRQQVFGPEDGPFKVGRAKDHEDRLSHYQTHNWFPLKTHLLVDCNTNKIKQIENDIKDALSVHRIRGEWYYCKKHEVFSTISSVFRDHGEVAIRKIWDFSISNLIRSGLQESIEKNIGYGTSSILRLAILDMKGNILVLVYENLDDNWHGNEDYESVPKTYSIRIIDETVQQAMDDLIWNFPDEFGDLKIAETDVMNMLREISHYRDLQGRI